LRLLLKGMQHIDRVGEGGDVRQLEKPRRHRGHAPHGRQDRNAPSAAARVAVWISATPAEHFFLSAITLGELQAGVEITRQHDPAKAKPIEDCIDTVAATHNVLPADGVIFRRWAKLMHHRRSNDLIEDALVAATALVHNLTVVTRTLRDFERLGVAAMSPFSRTG
jgi:hypothetical protein